MMDLREIDQSVGAGVEEVGRRADRHRLPRQVFGLVDATLPGDDLRPDSSPDDLREKVISGGELLADLGEALGIVVASLRVDRLREVRGRRRTERPVAHFLQRQVTRAQAPFGGGEIAGQELDDAVDVRNRGVARLPELFEDRIGVGEELSARSRTGRPWREALRGTGASTPPSSDSRSPRRVSPRNGGSLPEPRSARRTAMSPSSSGSRFARPRRLRDARVLPPAPRLLPLAPHAPRSIAAVPRAGAPCRDRAGRRGARRRERRSPRLEPLPRCDRCSTRKSCRNCC